jgi:hypothetical protein
MVPSTYYCKSVTIKTHSSVIDYIFNQYSRIIEHKEDSFPINLSNNDIEELNTLLKENTSVWFQDPSIKLISGLLFFLQPYENQPIHIDAQTKHSMHTSLNIPLVNCERGVMSWYSGNYFEEEIILDSGIRYFKLKIEDQKILYNQIIDSPYVVRTNIPHNVQNNLDKKRIMLALRYNKNIPELVI